MTNEQYIFPSNQEVVNIERARFMDKLEDEWEAVWDDFVDEIALIPQGNMPIPERPYGRLYAAWKDPSMPSAFQDRAMLIMKGSESAVEALSNNRIGRDHDYVESDRRDEFAAWLYAAFCYQVETGDPLLSDQTMLGCGLLYLDQGLINSEGFDTIINGLDNDHVIFNKARSRINLTGGWGGELRLDSRRLPLLDDILSGELGYQDSGPVKLWATHQVETCLAHIEDVNIPLQPWLEKSMTNETLKEALENLGRFPKYAY